MGSTSSLNHLRIAIVGGGIAGAATALMLGRLGAQITVFEKVEKPAAVGAGILLQPTGLAVLASLGAEIEQELNGSQIIQLLGHNPKGRVVLDSQYAHWQPNAYGLGICRGALFDALWSRIRVLSNVDLQAATPIVRMMPHAHGASIASEDKPLQTFDLVVVAEGVHSQLRHQLNIPASVKPYPWGAYWAIAQLPEDWPTHILLQRYRAARQMAGVLPMGRNPKTGKVQASLFWSAPTQVLKSSLNLGNIQQEIQALWPDLAPLLSQLTQVSQWTPAHYADVVLPYWHDRHTVLVGDAAHAMSPQLGQGATMGLIDAYVLAQALLRVPNVADALAWYSQSRRDHIRYYQWASRWLTPLFQSNQVLAPWLRDRLLTKGNAIPWLRHFNVETLVGIKTGWWRRSLDLSQIQSPL